MIFNEMSANVNPILEAIYTLPFNVELAKGQLAHEKFIYYLMQDSLYLVEFSRALALTAARLPDNKQSRQFLIFASEAVNAEQELHANYLKKHFATSQNQITQNPACFMYANYLLKMASTASVEEAVASLLPCFWVYQEVGKRIALTKTDFDNPYQEWITLYSSEQFAASVSTIINITNELGSNISNGLKTAMIAAFTRATQLEWLFWNSAYHLEKWLI